MTNFKNENMPLNRYLDKQSENTFEKESESEKSMSVCGSDKENDKF